MKRETKMKVLGCGIWAAWLVAAASGLARAQDDDPELGDKTLSVWLKQLQSMRRGDQLRAAEALSKAPEGLRPRIVPLLIPILGSARENDRFVAAQTLGNFGPLARAAVTPLLPLLEGSQFERNRAAGAKALGQILKDAAPSGEVEKVAEALIKLFDDKYVDVRREAVTACGMIGPAAKACLKHLDSGFAQVDSENGDGFIHRNAVAWTCGRMGPLGAVHIDRLIAQMHRDSKTGWGAKHSPVMAEALGRIGPVSDQVVPNLVDAMETRGKWQAGDAIIPFFAQAVETLLSFGPRAARAVPYLAKLAREGAKPWVEADVALLIRVVKALGAIGPAAKESVPALEALRAFKASKAEQAKELGREVEAALKAIQGGGS